MSHADAYRRDDADRRFLQSREWRERLRPRQLSREPLCRFCFALGIVRAAQQVDHIRRPKGDRALQRAVDNHQSLCVECHSRKSKWERGPKDLPLTIGFSPEGWMVTWRPETGIEGGWSSLRTDRATSRWRTAK